MTTGMTHEEKLEKQIEKQMGGCMAGFLHVFDRHQILSGRRFYTTKRLPPSTVMDAASGSDTSVPASPDVSRELAKTQTPKRQVSTPRKEAELGSPAQDSGGGAPPKSALPLPVFNLKQGATKTSTCKLREIPRLSLDSRAIFDAENGRLQNSEIRADRQILPVNGRETSIAGDSDMDEKQRPRSSTSVIARLMGLDPLSQPDSEPVKPAELRRSASESRVTRDLFHYRFIEANNPHPNQSHCNLHNEVVKKNLLPEYSNRKGTKFEVGNPKDLSKGGNVISSSSSARKSAQNRRLWFEAAEVFPETPKQTVSICGEIEKRLKKLTGIDEAATRDLESLKEILEAWQLKGLLHSRQQQTSEQRNSPENFVFDRNYPFDESPIAILRPSRPQLAEVADESVNVRRGGAPRNLNRAGEAPHLHLPERNARSPIRSKSVGDTGTRRSNTIVKQKPLSVETQRRINGSKESRRSISSIPSPGVNQRRTRSDPVVNRSPRSKKPTAGMYHKEKITTVIKEDEASSVSESTVSTSSQTDREGSKMDCKEGRSLLERCDKLLNSIAEMTATDQQSSPVSVLDSSFYESPSPSPIMKRTIDFKDSASELEEETWSQVISSNQSELDDGPDDCDLIYISEILRASHYLPEDSDIFSLLEKQQYLKGKNTSRVFRLERKLIFDITTEILERNRQLPPWKAFSWHDCISTKSSLQKIWSEFQKIRERDCVDDLVEVICGVLKKDLAGDAVNGWGERPMELSEVVLDIERMIFRDLVSETIRSLASTTVSIMPRRKLLF